MIDEETFTQTFWKVEASSMKTAYTDSIYYELLNNNGSGSYWLASRYTSVNDSSICFGLRAIDSGKVTGQSCTKLEGYKNETHGFSYRPVVTLSSSYINTSSGSGTSSSPYAVGTSSSSGDSSSGSSDSGDTDTTSGPKITLDKTSVTIEAGETASIGFTVEGAEPLTIKAYLDGELIDTRTNISSPWSSSLSATISKAGSYKAYVTVTDGNGKTTTSDTIYITVTGDSTTDTGYAPEITTDLKDVTVDWGGNAELEFSYGGTAPFTLKWYYNSTESYDGATLVETDTVGSEYSGKYATGSLSYSLTEVTKTRYYYFVITNDYGSTKTRIAKLTVNGVKPTITTQPEDVTVNIGDEYTFSCEAEGTPTLKVALYKNSTDSNTGGELIADDDDFIKTGDDDGGLIELSVSRQFTTKDQEGYYYFVVTNDYGSATSETAHVVVNGDDPAIITDLSPEETTINEGETADIEILISGTGPFKIEWYLNSTNSNTGGEKRAEFSKDVEGYYTEYGPGLTITGTSLNEGYWYCVVSNEYGSVTSRPVKLNVNTATAPTVTGPENKSIKSGESATFTVNATGDGTLTYQWYYSTSSSGTGTAINGATSPSYTVTNASTDNAGYYYCVVTNTVGTASKSTSSSKAKLTVDSSGSGDSDNTNKDTVAPTCTITPGIISNPTNSKEITYTFEFSEPVTGFTADDIKVENGTVDKSSFTASEDGKTYTVKIKYVKDGTQTVSIDKDVCEDESGNKNMAATSKGITIDTEVGVDINYDPATGTTSSVVVTITLDDDVDIDDVVLDDKDSWTKTTDSDGKTVLTKTYTENTKKTITVTDEAGNTKTETIEITNIDNTTKDTTAPTCTITTNTSDKTDSKKITYTFEFSEAVTGFDESDINVTNGTKGTFTKISDKKYTLVVNYSKDGIQTVSINEGACQDASGNNSKGASKSVTIDTSSKNDDNNNDNKVDVEVTYDYSDDGKSVVVTIISDEDINTTADGWEKSKDSNGNTTLKKTYTKNTEETIPITDDAGNKTTANIDVDKLKEDDDSNNNNNNSGNNKGNSDDDGNNGSANDGSSGTSGGSSSKGSSSSSGTSGKSDTTTATSSLPSTGMEKIILVVIAVLAVVGIVFFRKYRNIAK